MNDRRHQGLDDLPLARFPKVLTHREPAPTATSNQRTINSRRYAVQWLSPNSEIMTHVAVGPSVPVFEQAFCAFARGSLVNTASGNCAVEDLVPGMMVQTPDAGPEQLLRIGSTTILPTASSPDDAAPALYRVADSCFGQSSDMPDLLLGTGARILRNTTGEPSRGRLQNIEELCDGFSVIKVSPRSPVQVFHLGFASHRLINVNGLTLESFHPGTDTRYLLSDELFSAFLALFPHIRRSADFGPLNHRRRA